MPRRCRGRSATRLVTFSLALAAHTAGASETFGLPGFTTDSNYDEMSQALTPLGKATTSANRSLTIEPPMFLKDQRVVLYPSGAQGFSIGFEEIEPTRTSAQFSMWLDIATRLYGKPLSDTTRDGARMVDFCHSQQIGLRVFTMPTSTGVAFIKDAGPLAKCAAVPDASREALLTNFKWAASPAVTAPPQPPAPPVAQVTPPAPGGGGGGNRRPSACDALDQVVARSDENWTGVMGAMMYPQPSYESKLTLLGADGCQINTLYGSSFVCSFGAGPQVDLGRQRAEILAKGFGQCLGVPMQQENTQDTSTAFLARTEVFTPQRNRLALELSLKRDQQDASRFRLLLVASRPDSTQRPGASVSTRDNGPPMPGGEYAKAVLCSARLNLWLSYAKEDSFKPQAVAYTNRAQALGRNAGLADQRIAADIGRASELNLVPNYEGMRECGVDTKTNTVVAPLR